MRRQDLRLLTQVRQGDALARLELGRRYLLGVDGFARHVALAVEHLRHPAVAELPQAARLLAEHLPLHELLGLGQADMLARAAAAGSASAQARLGLWLCLRPPAGGADAAPGRAWLARAAATGHAGARAALAALDQAPPTAGLVGAVQALAASGDIQAFELSLLAARQALEAVELAPLQASLAAAVAVAAAGPGAAPAIAPAIAPVAAPATAPQAEALPDKAAMAVLAPLLAAALRLAEGRGVALAGVPPHALRQALELCAAQGDREAAYALGRGLCGIASPAWAPEVFAEHQNTRKGAAFLLRAADAGCDPAWLHLYRLHADHRLSVANPQMARFFLEKAALRGDAEAQRKLGALMLREASELHESEQALHWLCSAAAQGDAHARGLLRSLVLPVAGSAADADWALAQVRATDPWLAARLALARQFGLTKQEALSVDPAEGLRPWGLVVGRNPFISQARLAAARAVPALDGQALEAAQQAAALFAQSGAERHQAEGDLRNRALRQRRLFDRLGLDEALFFADASATTLDALRLGAKWAWRARQPLSAALAN